MSQTSWPAVGQPSPEPGDSWPPEGPPAGPPEGLPPAATRRPGGTRRFAAAVVAAAVLAGGAAGVTGAAVYDRWAGEGASTPTGDPVAGSAGEPGEAGSAATTGTAPSDGTVEQVAGRVLPSVVRIDVSGPGGSGSGSGIVLSADGLILTNEHVAAAGGEDARLRVGFDDGTTAPASLLGADPLTDTAVLRAEGVSGLTPAEIGSSESLAVGQQVVAIGSPFGLDATVTSGIVSALDRPVSVGADTRGSSTTYPAVQTDAAINPGNSGGPLVDMAGRVVGINSSIRSTGSVTGQAGSIGLGFAIPIDEVMPVVEQMIDGQPPTHARLGVSVEDAGTGLDDPRGALVSRVEAGSVADGAGLRVGDVITMVDGSHVTGADSLVATVRSYRPGDVVEVGYLREGREATVTVRLGSDAAS